MVQGCRISRTTSAVSILKDTSPAFPSFTSSIARSAGCIVRSSRHTLERPALDRRVRFVTPELQSVGASATIQVFDYVLTNAGPFRVVVDPADQLVAPSDLGPSWNECACDTRAGRFVGVLVGVHLQPLRSRAFDALDQRLGISPDTRSQRLDVRHDSGERGFACHADDFVDRTDDTDVVIRLVADVAGVETPVSRGDLCEFDDFLEFRVVTRRVVEPTGQAESTGFHATADQFLHILELSRRRLTILHADDFAAHGSVPDELRDIDADPVSGEGFALSVEIGRPTAIRVHDDRRDALGQKRLSLAQFGSREPPGRMRMDIDEARSEVEPTRVDHPLGSCGCQVSDRCNALA